MVVCTTKLGRVGEVRVVEVIRRGGVDCFHFQDMQTMEDVSNLLGL